MVPRNSSAPEPSRSRFGSRVLKFEMTVPVKKADTIRSAFFHARGVQYRASGCKWLQAVECTCLRLGAALHVAVRHAFLHAPILAVRRCTLRRGDTDTRRKFEFTGVGIASARNPTPRDWRKALTAFRESATPGRGSAGFSRLCPRSGMRPVLPAPRTEVPFFRHFSVMAGGIKTYVFGPRKKLSGWPGWPNTGCVLAVRCPRSSPGGHKI
jgi:hypothetical protein